MTNNNDIQFCGTITGTKGFDGRMTLKGTPEHILSIRLGAECFIGFSKTFNSCFEIASWKRTNKEHIFSVSGITSKEQAIHFKEQAVFVKSEDIILHEEESFSVGTLLDCFVYDFDNGEKIGKMKDVYILPGNDVWIVETQKGDLPIPYIDDVIKSIDIDNARIEIKMIDGLEELIDSKSNE
jgi:16S rRNA processing protein RimM